MMLRFQILLDVPKGMIPVLSNTLLTLFGRMTRNVQKETSPVYSPGNIQSSSLKLFAIALWYSIESL